MKILAIIQARIGSTRLPGKVLLKLANKTVLEHVISRVKHSKSITNTVVATTNKRPDTPIVKLCKNNGIQWYRGSENNVLDRYFQVACLYKPDHIVRITADCPLIDPDVIHKVIVFHLNHALDYTSNTIELSYPDGEDVEVFSFKALVEAWRHAKNLSELEHVTLYFRNHANDFKIGSLRYDRDLSYHRWTLDNLEDYKLIKIIFDHLYSNDAYFGMREVLTFIERNPKLIEINKRIGRNEGLQKSLKEDKIVNGNK